MDIQLDDNRDLLIENNDVIFIEGEDEIEQRVLQNLRMFQGEWFLNLDSGVPYYQDILVKNPNLYNVSAILKTAILDTPGVLEISNFTADFDQTNRELKVDVEFKVSEGTITISEVL